MLSTQDIAWAAGVYEGEGTCYAPTSKCRTQTVSVTQKDSWLPYHLQELFGGWVYHYTYKATETQPARDYFYRKCTGPTAREFLMTIFKFLSPRRKEQVKKALGERKNTI